MTKSTDLRTKTTTATKVEPLQIMFVTITCKTPTTMVFKENYLLSCQNEYEENIILRLVYEGLQVQIVGEGRFISVTRNKKE